MILRLPLEEIKYAMGTELYDAGVGELAAVNWTCLLCLVGQTDDGCCN